MAHVPASVQYGPNLRALATKLSIEQRLPSAQVAGLLNELSGTSFSERSLELTLQKAVQLSKPLRQSIAAKLHQSDYCTLTRPVCLSQASCCGCVWPPTPKAPS